MNTVSAFPLLWSRHEKVIVCACEQGIKKRKRRIFFFFVKNKDPGKRDTAACEGACGRFAAVGLPLKLQRRVWIQHRRRESSRRINAQCDRGASGGGKNTTDPFDFVRFHLPRSVDELIKEWKERKKQQWKRKITCAGLRCRSMGLIFVSNSPSLGGRRERGVYVEVWTQVQVIDALWKTALSPH